MRLECGDNVGARYSKYSDMGGRERPEILAAPGSITPHTYISKERVYVSSPKKKEEDILHSSMATVLSSISSDLTDVTGETKLS